MVRVSSKCPPGVLCLSPGIIFFGIIIIIGFIAILGHGGKTTMPVPYQPPEPPVVNVQVRSDSGGDDRFTRAPKPERNWVATPDLSAVWNSSTQTLPAIPTRGIPESYQSMGVLKTDSGQMLPLYGRRTSSRSDRFQYYTRTDSFNPVQLPLEYRRHNCQDDVGCEELYDGEKLKIGATGESAVATIYRFSGPTYVPAII